MVFFSKKPMYPMTVQSQKVRGISANLWDRPFYPSYAPLNLVGFFFHVYNSAKSAQPLAFETPKFCLGNYSPSRRFKFFKSCTFFWGNSSSHSYGCQPKNMGKAP